MGSVVQEQAVTSKPDYSRLKRDEIGTLLQLHRAGLTQTEIAQRLGCSQRTVSQWLSDLADTTEPAKLYLKGNALRMAQNIVKKGRAQDHVATLKGIGVLEEQQQQGLTVIVGGDAQVNIALLSPPSPE